MRSADLTQEASLKIWLKYRNDIEETISKAKTKEVDGNTHVCQLQCNIDKAWTNEQKLAYINKMIDKIKNCEEYDK